MSEDGPNYVITDQGVLQIRIADALEDISDTLDRILAIMTITADLKKRGEGDV